MSYADFLGLNEASLRELEDAAQQRAAQADETASSALGRAYQQASADVEGGGQGNLSEAQGYMDFVKAQREAQSARALSSTAGAYEQAARGGLRAGVPQPDYQRQQARMRTDLSGRRDAVAAGRAAQKAYADKQAAEREAQDKAFGEAQTRYTEGVDRELASMQPAIDRATGWSQYESSSPDVPDQQAAAQRRAEAQAQLNYYRPRQATLQRQRATFGRKA